MDYGFIALLTGFALILLGVWGILTEKNLIKIIIGFSLFDTGLHVVMVGLGYIKKGAAPIYDGTVAAFVDPVPQALVLTAIVIGLGVTALMLAYAVKLHGYGKSLDISTYEDLKW